MATSRSAAALPAYVLHQYDWSESSLVVELFTRAQGRVVVVAKGAKRPTSNFRPVLLPFQPLLVSLGKPPRDEAGEIVGLRAAEWAGGAAPAAPGMLFAGFYLNELLLKLLAREDPHAELFDAYGAALQALAGVAGSEAEAVLRRFERRLLEELGYGIDFEHDAVGARLDADAYYHFRSGIGFVAAAPGGAGAPVRGAELAGVAAEDYADPAVRVVARRVFREAIAACLDGRELGTRAVFAGMKDREQQQ